MLLCDPPITSAIFIVPSEMKKQVTGRPLLISFSFVLL